MIFLKSFVLIESSLQGIYFALSQPSKVGRASKTALFHRYIISVLQVKK